MNQIINKQKSFFFFVDCIKDLELNYFKIDNFFNKSDLLSSNKYFSVFLNSSIDFEFLEKNENLLSFFFIFNKFFFKNQIKNLKICLQHEGFFRDLKKKLNINFFLNFYFFFRYIYSFVFLLKRIALSKLANKY